MLALDKRHYVIFRIKTLISSGKVNRAPAQWSSTRPVRNLFRPTESSRWRYRRSSHCIFFGYNRWSGGCWGAPGDKFGRRRRDNTKVSNNVIRPTNRKQAPTSERPLRRNCDVPSIRQGGATVDLTLIGTRPRFAAYASNWRSIKIDALHRTTDDYLLGLLILITCVWGENTWFQEEALISD